MEAGARAQEPGWLSGRPSGPHVRPPTPQWGVCLKADSLVLEADF